MIRPARKSSSIANAASAKGSLSVEFYVPSLDGKYVAAALTEGGSEDCFARIFDVAAGKELSDVVPRVNFATAGGSIAWNADNSGFYYTRYPQNNERPAADADFYQQVYFHKLGTTRSKTPTSSARSSRASPKFNSAPATTDSGCSPPSPTAMVASSRTMSWTPTAAGARSPTLKMAWSPPNSAPTPRSTCSPAKTHRVARSCAFLWNGSLLSEAKVVVIAIARLQHERKRSRFHRKLRARLAPPLRD